MFPLLHTSDSVTEALFEKLKLAYIVLDEHMCVSCASDNLSDYGFDSIALGDQVDEHIDFLVGLEPTTKLDLPVLSSPSGKPISVTLMPDNNQLNVFILDAGVEFDQQQLLQQKANEVQLLSEQQQKLMLQLEDAKQQLEVKNTKLEEAARLQTSFLSGVSHEFRTPLTSIIGYTELLQREPSENQQLDAIDRSSKHLLSLVENLLDHGKIESGSLVINPKPVSLADVLYDVQVLLEPLAKSKNIGFSIQHQFSKLDYFYIDDSRLRQCLINIIGNAIKFTDQGQVSCSVVWQDDQLSITVKDTGMGIAEQDIDSIFDSFWQAKNTGKAGTGLGLTITSQLIDLMGGELDVQSSVGQGTTMLMTLLAPKVIDAITQKEAQNAYSVDSLRILLVEDDDDIANLLSLLLSEQGAIVSHATNGQLAVEMAVNNEFDIIYMDIHMPVLDGYQAMEAIRDSGINVPIIVMSATILESDKLKAQEMGSNGYLVKPVDVNDILKLTQELLT